MDIRKCKLRKLQSGVNMISDRCVIHGIYHTGELLILNKVIEF